MQVCSTYWKCVALNHGLCVSIALLDESDKGSRINLKSNKNIRHSICCVSRFTKLSVASFSPYTFSSGNYKLATAGLTDSLCLHHGKGTHFLCFLIWPAVSNRDSHRNAIVPGLTARTVHLRKVASREVDLFLSIWPHHASLGEYFL